LKIFEVAIGLLHSRRSRTSRHLLPAHFADFPDLTSAPPFSAMNSTPQIIPCESARPRSASAIAPPPVPRVAGRFSGSVEARKKKPHDFRRRGVGSTIHKICGIVRSPRVRLRSCRRTRRATRGLGAYPNPFRRGRGPLVFHDVHEQGADYAANKASGQTKEGLHRRLPRGGNRARDGCPGLGQVDAPDARNGNGDEKLIN